MPFIFDKFLYDNFTFHQRNDKIKIPTTTLAGDGQIASQFALLGTP
jgi:hypothetical protein|tara:strand:- start:1043 stop:1180 length:138 start_codon:yes stop_codon:yes gene_type:complete